ALRSDVQRARALALRADSLARGQPGAVRALSLLDLPSNPAAASTRLRAVEGIASGPLLVDRAMLALTARRDAEACEVLDEAIGMDPRSAPAFALRALVRMRNGDMRGGWSDAEMARQLGRPAWGDALEILAASRVSERQELLPRLERYVRSVRADSTEISVLDARLAFIALSAAG